MSSTLRHIYIPEVAAKMLKCDPKDIPPDLRRVLFNISSYCQRAGGELRSRQMIAAIIALWMEASPDASE